VVTWAGLEAAAPDLAGAGRGLLYRDGSGRAFLATVREGSLPRIHPISVGIVGGRLYAFINRSAKGLDLELDRRYALHAHVDPLVPAEFELRGRGQLVETEAVRTAVAADWVFDVDDSYRLFEFSIESALLGLRSSPDDWPPQYTSWTASP
jgi:hypothetical protein